MLKPEESLQALKQWSLSMILVLLSCRFECAFAQCDHGLEPTCVWSSDLTTPVQWISKTDSGVKFVQLSDCDFPTTCGIAILQTPWLQPLPSAAQAELQYKIYGTKAVYLRLNMKLDDSELATQIFSKTGNYAYGYPDNWSNASIRLPRTDRPFKLYLKAYVPYKDAMVAVRGINMDGQSSSTNSTRPAGGTSIKTGQPISNRTLSPSSSLGTSTSTVQSSQLEEQVSEEISPTQYGLHTPETTTSCSEPKTSNPDNLMEYGDGERRVQDLEIRSYIEEEDIATGFTEVVEPRICYHK